MPSVQKTMFPPKSLTEFLSCCWNLKAFSWKLSLSSWLLGKKKDLAPVILESVKHLDGKTYRTPVDKTKNNFHLKKSNWIFSKVQFKRAMNNQDGALISPFTVFSPVVGDEGVSERRVGVWGHSCHAAVHKRPQRDMETPEDGHLDVDGVAQEVNIGRSARKPVL